MLSQELIDRTKMFALQIIGLADSLPTKRSAEILAKQIIRSATSVSANYRAACRAQSTSEFIAKMHDVHEEADETQHWLELLYDSKSIPKMQFETLWKEASELTAIFTASYATARRNKNNKKK
ncbi:MAG: four helix bundle protein [Bacteroidota bacterium]|nr:four helix bundle protein [Bacteroidota bacterium]